METENKLLETLGLEKGQVLSLLDFSNRCVKNGFEDIFNYQVEKILETESFDLKEDNILFFQVEENHSWDELQIKIKLL